MADKSMYSATWGRRTEISSQSMPHVTIDNFHLSSAITALYDSPSPFPYFEYTPIDGKWSLRTMLWRWFMILRHLHRFRIQLAWNSKAPLFPHLVEYFPDLDPGKKPRGLAPFYREYRGKKFNGTFLKASDQLQAMDSVVPKEKFQHVCEIGGGFGAMVEMIVKRYKPRLYCIIDLPETLRVSWLYLGSVFPDLVQKVEPGKPVTLKPGQTNILFLECTEYERLKEFAPEIGLFINGNSFAEMDLGTVRKYFALIERYPDCYLSNTNPPRWEGEYLYAGPETYPYSPGRWEFVYRRRQRLYYWKRNGQMIAHFLPEGQTPKPFKYPMDPDPLVAPH